MIERIAVGAFAANCWIIPLAKSAEGDKDGPGGAASCILVDPGAEAEMILSFLDARSLVPTLIVCTHGHLDHICAIAPLKSAFEGRGRAIPVSIHRDDAAYLGAEGKERNRRLFQDMGAASFFDSLWTDVPEADILLDEGRILNGTSWRVIHTPGHSKGSICLYDEGAGLLISGDTIFRDGV
ncbi:MAG TPA: MBL fold metallo-hydrolase, partial [Rectinemataceae bacterium]|nr:MBL fold metallo-hydrolase [Rectinemataceae bacterium]